MGDAVSPDSFILLLDISEPLQAGHPSMPELRDRILAAIQKAYIDHDQPVPVINLLFWRGELVSARRATI